MRTRAKLSHNAPRDSSFLLQIAGSSPLRPFNTQKRNEREEKGEKERREETDDGRASDAENFFLKSRDLSASPPPPGFSAPSWLSRGVQSGINNLAPRRINKLAPAARQSEEKGEGRTGPGRRAKVQTKRQTQEGSRRASGETGGAGGRREKRGRNCERVSRIEWLFLQPFTYSQ